MRKYLLNNLIKYNIKKWIQYLILILISIFLIAGSWAETENINDHLNQNKKIDSAIASKYYNRQDKLNSSNLWDQFILPDNNFTNIIFEEYINLYEIPNKSYRNEMLINPKNIKPSNIILDISSSKPENYIVGAIAISYKEFIDENYSVRPVKEISRILGDNGISANDSIIIYGKCMPCGGGPSTATFAYWVLRYVGHENVKVLDGGMDAWIAEGLPVQNESSKRIKANYVPNPQYKLRANYGYIISAKDAQIIDARSSAEFSKKSIPGSINIPNDMIVEGERIKNETVLRSIFSKLDGKKPIVVYTNTGVKASAVWFALSSEGFDARLYSFRDWVAHLALKNSTESQ